MDFTIEEEKEVYKGFLSVKEARVVHNSYSGTHKIKATREAVERGNAVAVLLYERDSSSFLLVEQFRYPAARRNMPWSLELPAGAIDAGEHPKDAARREVLEEIGYKVDHLEQVATYFPSPGVSSELIHIFYGEVTSKDQLNQNRGNVKEQEDIKMIKGPLNEVEQGLKSGRFNNSITLIGLQWWLLHKK